MPNIQHQTEWKCPHQRQENLTPDLEQKGHDNKNSMVQEIKTKELRQQPRNQRPTTQNQLAMKSQDNKTRQLTRHDSNNQTNQRTGTKLH